MPTDCSKCEAPVVPRVEGPEEEQCKFVRDLEVGEYWGHSCRPVEKVKQEEQEVMEGKRPATNSTSRLMGGATLNTPVKEMVSLPSYSWYGGGERGETVDGKIFSSRNFEYPTPCSLLPSSPPLRQIPIDRRDVIVARTAKKREKKIKKKEEVERRRGQEKDRQNRNWNEFVEWFETMVGAAGVEEPGPRCWS